MMGIIKLMVERKLCYQEFHGDFWHGIPSKYLRSMINPVNRLTMGELYDKTLGKKSLPGKVRIHLLINLGAQWGGGTLIFSRIRRLGPSIYRSPKKNIRNFKHPQKIFEILATPKNILILYIDLKKDPKMHRNDPQTSPIL